MTAKLVDMPLFPLHTVLFPGMPLPLHIFEERYKLMIQECLDSAQPFGVVLIKHGREVGEDVEPYLVGTSAVITQTTKSSEEAFDILSVGYQRFRIHSLSHDRPFLSAKVELLHPVDEESEAAFKLADLLRPRLQEYVELLADLTDTEIGLPELPDKPVLLAFLTAILLQVPLQDKQDLLAAESIPVMLARENFMLAREQKLLQANIGMEFTLQAHQTSFSAS